MTAPKIHSGRNGWYVAFEKTTGPGGTWWHATLHDSQGNTIDRVRCDNYRDACCYRRAFVAIAKGK